MTTCAGCGHSAGPSDRFCPRCGLPLGAADGLEGLSAAPISPLGSDTVQETETRIRRNPGRRSRWRVAAVLVAVMAVAGITWTTTRPPTRPISGLVDDAAGPATTALDETTDVAARVSTTVAASGSEESADRVTVVDPGRLDPALADYQLLASRNSELVAIDLATGEATSHRVSGRLIGSWAGRIVVIDPASGATALPTADLSAEPEQIFAVEPDGSLVVSAFVDDSGILHLTTTNPSAEPGRSVMTRLDLETGLQLSVEVPSMGAMGLVEVPGGGVFSLDEDGFRRLTDASVELYGSTYLVVERCDDPLQCRRFWVQRFPGVRVGRPLPAFRSGYALGRGGRVAVGVGPDQPGFFDVRMATEVPIADAYRDTDGPWFVIEDLTDDERFLGVVVGASGNDVLIHDLDDQTAVRFELGRSSPLSKVLFVPKADRR